jgi:hypothetical protein
MGKALKTYQTLAQPPPPSWGFPDDCRSAGAVVAVPSRRAALQAFQAAGLANLTYNHLAIYGGQTWNEVDVAAAESDPGVVFARNEPFGLYRRVI